MNREPSTFNGMPFPWEPSIGNETPKNIVSREVADFLGIHVLQFPQIEEVQSRGAQFEIEAKLGTIIDKQTNDRIFFPEIRAGECVLSGNRVAFRSSMTEVSDLLDTANYPTDSLLIGLVNSISIANSIPT